LDRFHPFYTLLLANTKSEKTKREEREEDIMAVLADDGANVNEKHGLLLLLLFLDRKYG
jgi:hypothetical protein